MKKYLTQPIGLAIVACVALALCMPAMAQKADDYKGDPYTAGICPISGSALGSMGDPILMNHNGRDVRLCCGGCTAKFEADPAAALTKVDAKMVEQQTKHYPLNTDVVSGQALGDNPIDIIHMNRLVRLGSPMNVQKFNKDPEKYIAKLDEAVIAKQVDSYPLTTCVVSGEALDAMGDPIQLVAANRLVQLCCAGCVNQFWNDPNGTFSKLDSGTAATGHGHSHGEGHGHSHGDGGHEGHGDKEEGSDHK